MNIYITNTVMKNYDNIFILIMKSKIEKTDVIFFDEDQTNY